MQNIAFLGCGAMGSRMAKKLLDAGHVLTVYNRAVDQTQELVASGARHAQSPREAVKGADIVISMVTNDEASRNIWLNESTGAVHTLEERSIVIECSTLRPVWVRELAAAVAKRDAEFLDAPVIGSRPQAEAGELIFVVGGETAVLACVNPILMCMGSAIHHMGSWGAGSTLKLAVNTLFACQVAALGEMLGLLQRADFSLKQALQVLAGLPTTSPALKGIGALIDAEKYAPLFPVNLVHKDLNYLMDTAEGLHALVPLAATAHSLFQRAEQEGYAEQNINAVAKLYFSNEQ